MYGAQSYTYEVETLTNSIDEGNTGLSTFRIIASMDEGLWLSPTEMGYSIDNISPSNPIGISVTIINNEINLGWIPNIEFDFSYYKIYRRSYGQENWIYDGSSALNFYSLSYNPDIVDCHYGR